MILRQQQKMRSLFDKIPDAPFESEHFSPPYMKKLLSVRLYRCFPPAPAPPPSHKSPNFGVSALQVAQERKDKRHTDLRQRHVRVRNDRRDSRRRAALVLRRRQGHQRPVPHAGASI